MIILDGDETGEEMGVRTNIILYMCIDCGETGTSSDRSRRNEGGKEGKGKGKGKWKGSRGGGEVGIVRTRSFSARRNNLRWHRNVRFDTTPPPPFPSGQDRGQETKKGNSERNAFKHPHTPVTSYPPVPSRHE